MAMPTCKVIRCLVCLVSLSPVFLDPSLATPIKIKETSEDLKSLKERVDEPLPSSGLKPDPKGDVEDRFKESPFKRLRNRSENPEPGISPSTSLATTRSNNGRSFENSPSTTSTVVSKSLGNSPSTSLSTIASRAKNSFVRAVSSIVKPIDDKAKTAVSGAGLTLGLLSGITSEWGRKAYNCMVRVHNANIDNLSKLRNLVGKVGSSAVDLGASGVTEAGNVLDAVRREENRILTGVTEKIPVVRHLVGLRNLAGLAKTSGIQAAASAVKRLGDLAVNAVTLRKTEEVTVPTGGIGGFLRKIEGLSGSDLITVGLALGTSKGNVDTLRKIASTTGPESAFKIGEAIGRHKSSPRGK
ncbi:unnamed protein product [Bemisia tabaci]|uniref:Uncharacterized protein n=1 Tax=Bemisia tabaci TaxID=7038 RepID=A0A9P0F6Q4_BEMTA|nr:unnamed protein product [Bemisia tabaci]